MRKIDNNILAVLFCFAVVAVSFFVYFPAFETGFIWDDHNLITKPPQILTDPLSLFRGGELYYRPFTTLSILVDHYLWHSNAKGYHFTNIILHTINSLLLFLLSLLLLKSSQEYTDLTGNIKDSLSKKNLWISFIVALFFVVHPVHVEAVAWISGRTDLLSTFFLMLAFISCCLYLKDGRLSALFSTGIFFIFSLFSKENGVAFVFIIFSYWLIFKTDSKKMISVMLVCFLMIAFYCALRISPLFINQILAGPNVKEVYFAPTGSVSGFILTLLFGCSYYVEKLLLPLNLSLIAPLSKNPIYLLFFIFGIVSGVLFYWKKKKLELFLLLWIFVTLIPVLPIIYSKMPNLVAERYLYLPSAGFSLLFVYLWRNTPIKVSTVALSISLIFFTCLSVQRIEIWRNPIALWEDTFRKNPESAVIHINYANVLVLNGKQKEGKQKLLSALEQKPINALQRSLVFNMLGLITFSEGNNQGAEMYFIKAIATEPRNEVAVSNLGVFYAEMGRITKQDKLKKQKSLYLAIGNSRQALRISPNFILAMQNIANCYIYLGEFEKAKKYLRMVVDTDPQSKLGLKAAKLIMSINNSVLKSSSKIAE